MKIERLLDIAESALRQSLFYLELGRPDTAYVEYVVAYEIVTDIIPHAKDAPSIRDKPSVAEKQRALRKVSILSVSAIDVILTACQRLGAQEDRYADVRDAIKADNARNATTPILLSGGTASRPPTLGSQRPPYPSDTRPTSLQSHSSSQQSRSQDGFQQRHSYPISPSQEHPPANSPVSKPQLRKTAYKSSAERPQIDKHRQNETRHGYSDASLSDRFAKLRTTTPSTGPGSQGTFFEDEPTESQPLSSADYSIKRDAPSLHMTSSASTQVNASKRSTAHVDTTVTTTLPKQPSPAYTPTSASQDRVRFQPPRSLRNSHQPLNERPLSTGSNASSVRPSSRGSTHQSHAGEHEGQTFPSQVVRRRRRSVHQPQETDLSAEKLYDYLSKFDVLLVDVRPRSEFDSGHIFHRSIICVEPAALREHMSAEALQEALVLSPEHEQTLFDQRNQFDLVVYYDQSSDISDWGPHRQRSPNRGLQYINDALLDFNQEKPLQWPPIILNGGLDAWVDLMGPQTLAISSTTSRPRPHDTFQRRPAAELTTQLDIRRRRHREYNPLDREEEQKWRERARSASVMLDQRPQVETFEAHENVDDGTISTTGYADFAHRFPDVATVEEQHRWSAARDGSHVPQYPIPQPPSTSPLVPTTHIAHQLASPPAIPARPPPAVPRRTYSGVGDRLPQTSAPARPPKLAEYVAPRFRRLPLTGLHNFGVTCYMNATIQCLSATVPLTAFFLESNLKDKLQRENWKGSKGILGELYYILLRNLWEATDADTIRPSNFRKFCARLNKEWGSDRQQDAKEFLEFLIDGLHEDLNQNWHRTPLRPLTDEEEVHRERTPALVASKTEWKRSIHRDYSKLTDIFAGQHMSRLQCTACGHSSTTYEPFYSISVEIPKSSGRPIDIRDCFASYCSAEMLSGDEVWRCPHCKCEREATKRITITRAPETLVVHFKRFSASHSQSAKKITAPIDFPLENLDLGPFMLQPPDASSAEYIQRKYGASALDMPTPVRPPYRYDCYAVMRHLGGTIASGHYIALVKDEARQCWRKFDDSRVTNFQPEQLSRGDRLQNEQAYIVFYRRVAANDGPGR